MLAERGRRAELEEESLALEATRERLIARLRLRRASERFGRSSGPRSETGVPVGMGGGAGADPTVVGDVTANAGDVDAGICAGCAGSGSLLVRDTRKISVTGASTLLDPGGERVPPTLSLCAERGVAVMPVKNGASNSAVELRYADRLWSRASSSCVMTAARQHSRFEALRLQNVCLALCLD